MRRCPLTALRLFASALLVALLPSLAAAAGLMARHPTGTIVINQGQAGFIVTAGYGGGVLRYAGRSFGFKIAGLGVGGIGASSVQAMGIVYDLHSIADFPGPYVVIRAGAAIGEKSIGRMWLRNPHGVTLKLNAKRRGLMLAAGADSVVISMVPGR
ncbi:hypothetical protein SAMN05519103_04649 [Rhizobiales bacterium GAS113]|nr:hypothetical protein SAMN05519103_04649 [Rhizobiales bacterium GAS113]SEE25942.1 hypothetical protein SAMN05519104_5610 [Rhizobiales bacterium GAS188]